MARSSSSSGRGWWRALPLPALVLLALLLLPSPALGSARGRQLLAKKHKLKQQQAAAAASPAAEAAAAVDCCALLPPGFNVTLPVVVVDLQGAPLSSIPKPQIETGVKAKIPATACTCGAPGGDWAGAIQFSERGSHSEDWDQVRSYSISTKPSAAFLGMPKGGSWSLYGWQNDTGGLHDWFGFQLYRASGNYAERTQYCELFLTNGSQPLAYPSTAYLGLYLAMEHISQGKHRVDIKKDKAGDSGANSSFILDNEHGKTKQGLVELAPLPQSKIQYMVEYPKQPSQEQQDYILGYLRQLEGALFGPAFADPAAGWRALANASSAVDFFLFEELIKSNNNGYRGSQRLYKDAGGPLNFGPPWDFNDGFGQCCGFPIEGYQNGGASNGSSGGSAISPEGWSFNICEQPERCKTDPIAGIALWYRRMWQDPAFQRAAAQRFAQLRASAWTDAWVGQQLAAAQANIHDALLRTFQRWPVDLLNPYAPVQPTPEAQLQATIDKLRGWTTARLDWMAAQFAAILGGAPPAPANATAATASGTSPVVDGGSTAPASSAAAPSTGGAPPPPATPAATPAPPPSATNGTVVPLLAAGG